jgi:hypothetical protein
MYPPHESHTCRTLFVKDSLDEGLHSRPHQADERGNLCSFTP